ncbi:MAG: UDP-N-acetylmuramoyl-tripeptide--D-alanyl-D-alanine ligase [Psychroflexus halocasei]
MTLENLHTAFLKSTGVSTDSRKIEKDQIFFALKGDNFNGNQYAQKAIDQGAKLVVIDDENYKTDKTFLVDDVLQCLQNLARFHRRYLNLVIIAITGSNGKTTTKNLIKEVLSQKFEVKATKGNLNNHIGVPLTLLSFNMTHEIGIVEMGANHQGEIKALCEIAEPNYGYITNFGKAHLEGFGGIEGIIKGKSELYEYLISVNKKIFINADDPIQVAKTQKAKVYTIGEDTLSDCRVKLVEANPNVNIDFCGKKINSQLLGAYNFKNISIAIGFGIYFGIKFNAIKKAIENYKPENMRSQIIDKENFRILLDAYNANPTSMNAAINAFINIDSKHHSVILGDMFEIGETKNEEHQKIIDFVLNQNFQNIILVGKTFYELAKNNSKIKAYPNTSEVIESLDEFDFDHNIILVKGSRGMQLETLVDELS